MEERGTILCSEWDKKFRAKLQPSLGEQVVQVRSRKPSRTGRVDICFGDEKCSY